MSTLDHNDSLQATLQEFQSPKTRESVAPDWLQLGVEELDQLWMGSHLAQRIIETLPLESIRRGWRITVPGEDVTTREQPEPFRDDLARLRAAEVLSEADTWARLYGGAAVIIGADDGLPMSEPIDRTRLRRVQWLIVADRWELTPSIDVEPDPDSPWYGQPRTYLYAPSGSVTRVVGSDGRQFDIASQTVHASRVLRFVGKLVPHRRRAMYSGWGAPVLDAVWRAVHRFGATEASLSDVLRDIEFGVLSVRGLANMVTTDKGRAAVVRRATTLAMSKSVAGVMLVDQEGERYDRSTSQSAAGLSDIYDRMMMSVAAAAEMPVTHLFGMPPKGFSGDDKAGRTAWYNRVSTHQARAYKSPLLYLCQLLRDSADGPEVALDAAITVEFLPLEEPTDEEKARTRLTILQGDKLLWEMGGVDEMEIRGRESGAGFSYDLRLLDRTTRERLAADEGVTNEGTP